MMPCFKWIQRVMRPVRLHLLALKKVARTRLAKQRTLKLDQVLAARSAVPVPKSFVQRSQPHKGLTKKINLNAKPQVKKQKQVDMGVWDAVQEAPTTTEDMEFILDVVAKKAVKAPVSVNAPLVDMPAVQVAHPGASYIPHATYHQELLQAVEESKRVEPRVLFTQIHVDETPDMDADDEETENTEQDTSIKTQPKPKTKKQRKSERIGRRKLLDVVRRRKRNIREEAWKSIKSINKSVNKKYSSILNMTAIRAKLRAERQRQPRVKLGNLKYASFYGLT
jgi:hypothetical protein